MQMEQVHSTTEAAEMPLSTKVMRNAMFGGLRYLLVAPIPFVMTPLILHKIGVGGYGTWAVFLAINGLTSLADLGLVGTLSKFVAEYYAHRDFGALSRVLSSGFALFLGLATVIGVGLWIATPWLAGWLFHGSAVVRTEVILLFRIFSVVVAANILNLMFSSVTAGLQRLDITNLISAGNLFLSALFSAMLLLQGQGLRGLVFGYIVSAVLTVCAYVLTVRSLLPKISINPLHFDKQEARKMFSFSFRLYFTQAAVAVNNQIEKLFLAFFVGVAAAGWYDIASDVASKIRGAIGFLLSPVLPAASELSALGDESRLRELYFRTHKYLALAGIPAVCFVAAVSGRFVDLWIGPAMKMVALPLAVLVVVSLLNLATGPGFLIYAGRGFLKPGVNGAIIGIASNLVLSFLLIYMYGFGGAVVGTSASLILAAVYFIWVFHVQTRYSFSQLMKAAYLKPLLCTSLAMTAVFVINPGTNVSWIGLLAMGLAFGLVYSILILLSRFFDAYDWSKIEGIIPAVRHARRLARFA
jgi:O-antigen/teichoic acid export membrane protein